MVAPGNVNPQGMQAPPPAGQGRQPLKAAGVAPPTTAQQCPEGGNYQGTPRPASAKLHSTEVLHQRKNVPVCPVRLAAGGFAIVAVLGYFTLYSSKKPEATALDVAKVATSAATAENARSRK